MLFVDGFEDTEAIATMDVLKRGGDEVICASLMKRKEICPKFSKGYLTDCVIEDLDYRSFDGIVIPGGPGSFKIMPDIEIVNEMINYFAQTNKLVASICAAPHLVGRLGYFKNRPYTVHPGFEDKVVGGKYMRKDGVVVSDNFITAKSMYYSIDFALEIHKFFHGKASAEELRKACQGEGK